CQYFTIIDGSGSERSAGLVLWDARRDVAVLRPESDGPIGQPYRGAGLQLLKPSKGVPIGAVRIAALDVLNTRTGGPSLKSRTASPPNVAPLGPTRSIVLEGEPLDPGASGAPVLDGEGHVVGMVTANVPLNINRETIKILTVATDAVELEGALKQAGGDNNTAPPNITISGPEPVKDLANNVVRIRCR
ncbi:MAG: trypsin-like peptidase domain-containing protein, partial [Pseudomonadota bacterium]